MNMMNTFGKLVFFLFCNTIFFSVNAESFFQDEVNLTHFYKKGIYYYTKNSINDEIKFFMPSENHFWFSSEEEAQNNIRYTIHITCDKDIQYPGFLSKKWGKKTSGVVLEKSIGIYKIKLVQGVHCLVKGEDYFTKRKFEIELRPLEDSNSTFAHLHNSNDEKYLNLNYESAIMDTPFEAFNKRVKALMGKGITLSEWSERNPRMALDFSNLPKLDMIYVSTLNINYDFVNTIIFRLMLEHAKRGATVFLTMTDMLNNKKEEEILARMESESPNFKVLKYKVRGGGSGEERLKKLQQVHHGKVFLTYSQRDPGNNILIGGGRNMSDRYYFESNKIFTDPEFTEYGESLSTTWGYFYDMDYFTKNQNLVREAWREVLSFSSVKNYPEDKFNFDNYFMISVPFSDESMLEARFIEAIDRAKVKIKIMSPYIYFTDNINIAFEQAMNRGVEIEIVLSASLFGDEMTKKLKRVYDSFVVRKFGKMKVRSYDAEPTWVLHRKGMLIDSKYLVIGSVNMSQRSFYHDVESTYFTTDRKLISDYEFIFDRMFASSQEIAKFISLRHFENLILEVVGEDLF